MKVFRKISLIILFVLCACFVSAGTTQEADRVNYWNDTTHTVTVKNNCGNDSQVNITIPSGFTYDSGTCTNPSSSLIVCDITDSSSAAYVVNSSSSASEYTVSDFTPITNNSCSGNDVSFIKIKDDEIFHTLVEYGRGRGNYFFDSFGEGYAGSGHTGTGCSYLPNGTMYELNFLHKVNNVKQYFGNLSAIAYNATFSCSYPNSSVVREHLITSIVTNSTGAYTDYKISKIEGSWERMGFLGMDFDEGEYMTGQNFTISCTDLTYIFPEAGGNFVVDEDTFTFQVRDREPFIANAATSEIIGNGTQEVLITYNITNNEIYTVDDIIIEIQAPPYATFIGTRGELWGAAQDQYRIEKTQLLPGESELVRLIARFDTGNAPSMSSVDLTDGIRIKYVTCWELNAYNPNEYTQTITGIGNGTVNMGLSTNITSVISRIIILQNITTTIETTVSQINTTVYNIYNVVDVINSTTQDTNLIVNLINSTTYDILNQSSHLLNNTDLILNDTAEIYDLLNCNGTNDSPICDKVNTLNNSISEIWNISVFLNHTANNLNITVIENINTSGVNITVNIDLTNLTDELLEIKSFINCSNITAQPNTSVCNRLDRIENTTVLINSTLNSLSNTTSYFNTTVFGNYTFQTIIDAISNISVDTSEVLIALQEAREFDEELVFLVTDSFGLQQSADADFKRGDVVSAADKLSEANAKMTQTMNLLISEQNELTIEEPATVPRSGSNTVLIAIIAALAMIIVVLLAKKPPKREGDEATEQGSVLKIIPLIFGLALCAGLANAGWGPLGTIVQEAGALNFGEEFKNQTIYIYYNCTGSRTFNVTLPAGFALQQTSTGCGLIGSQVSCSFNDVFPGDDYGWYKIGATANFSDYQIIDFPTALSNTTDCSASNNISFIKIPDQEVFHTLVEYGRGRGNYFYSTQGGRAGSGGTGTGCNYVPNGTMFELNFLHKIFNIKQYYNDAYALATNATFTCSYPNRTIVRSHLGTDISQSSAETNITYLIDEIEGSWERMGYVGMQFDATEQQVGENLSISCDNISYYLDNQNGFITVYVDGISFDLEVRDPYPFTVSASTDSTVGNGTQEVIIMYNITNTEVYTVDDVVIEIDAPPYAEFIGTRGELWGGGLDQYRIEKTYLAPGESEIIYLVARFDTSNTPDMSSISLSDGVSIKYVTCWDLNAYNPAESIQRISNIGNTTLDMGTSTEVIDLRERIEIIINVTNIINTTTIEINNTVNIIDTVVTVINSTTIDTNTIVKEINNTVNFIYGNVSEALTNTYSIINYTTDIKDLLNCNGTNDSPWCLDLDGMNSTVNNISSLLIDVNSTLSNISINVTINLAGENISVNITPDLTNISLIINDIKSELNCSNVTGMPEGDICLRLIDIENNTDMINHTVNNINDLINYINGTVFGNITLEDIYNSITNITLDTSELLTEIRRMREFDEELVFLITDSFGLQQAARSELDSGNVEDAAEKLRQANERLNQAALRLVEVRNEETQVTEKVKDNTLVIALLLILLCLTVVIYVLVRPPPKGDQPTETEKKHDILQEIKQQE